MRGLIEGFESPAPLLGALPAVYQEDPFTARFTLAFDDVLTAVILTLDNLDAYVDPALAPPDFVALLATWVGFPIGESWPENPCRKLVAEAVEFYRWRGTVRGLKTILRAFTGLEPEVVDTGGVTWSTVPGSAVADDHGRSPAPAGRPTKRAKGKGAKAYRPPAGRDGPGSGAPHLLVRVRPGKSHEVDARQLEALINAAKPAHVPYTLEVL